MNCAGIKCGRKLFKSKEKDGRKNIYFSRNVKAKKVVNQNMLLLDHYFFSEIHMLKENGLLHCYLGSLQSTLMIYFPFSFRAIRSNNCEQENALLLAQFILLICVASTGNKDQKFYEKFSDVLVV